MCTGAFILHINCFSFNCFLSSSIPSFYYCIIFMSKHFSTWHFLSEPFASIRPAFYCFMGEGHHGSWFYFLPDYMLSDMNTVLISKKHRCFIFYLLERGGRQRQLKVYWCCWFTFRENKHTSTQLSGWVCDPNAGGPGYDFPMPQKKQTAPIVAIDIAMFS